MILTLNDKILLATGRPPELVSGSCHIGTIDAEPTW